MRNALFTRTWFPNYKMGVPVVRVLEGAHMLCDSYAFFPATATESSGCPESTGT
ncbi:hypothetical protein M758_9G094500 [Ceratodon purpureus]|nr:hypothetical protein M758_9G094500 [Ceratodon purpureus]